MDVEETRSDERVVASRDGPVGDDAVTAAERLEDELLTRLERIVALAGKRGEPALHDELLHELRSLVREAESSRQPLTASDEEVVERPARRLHGT
jgi:hypothetical protein